MINILFFAQLREQLGTDTLNMPYEDNMTVAILLAHLKAENTQWQPILSSQTLMVAVNQSMGNMSTPLCRGDEVAFFPPVTGG
ncbi:molybdopterin converting factor subunit 1 [Psychromonas sp. CNPT3]|uniref:molybdopterin converting factor subunit 1 n=1 Tax=Psychromonas sp. CNPT3 TaxID=314282 RepID=UPI00006E481F|nr:molybdopterin converting factor subunit 1 [Psychromonas sp. CNPT3]AGH81232.1 molybdopterin converting factor subunit 1 [Psychromonas sp. CNPT3]